MDTRSDNDIVIEHTVRLERLLKESYKATGTGLGMMLVSVSDRIPESLIRDGRKIAAIRNKVVHENVPLKNRKDFIRRCEKLEKKLSHLAPVQAGNIAEKHGIGTTSTGQLAFVSNRFYWFLLLAAIIIAGIQVVDGLLQATYSAQVFSLIAKVYLIYLLPSLAFLVCFLFLKNIFLIFGYGWIVGTIFDFISSPIMLVRLIYDQSLFGTLVAAFLLGISVVAFLLNFSQLSVLNVQIGHTLGIQINKVLYQLSQLYQWSLPNQLLNYLGDIQSATAITTYALPTGKVIIGLYLLLFYIISSIHRYFYKRVSGHAVAALLLYFFGIKALGFSVIFAIPLVLFAFVDFYDLARNGQLMKLPKDPLRQFIIGPTFSTRQQKSNYSTNSLENKQEEYIVNPFQAEQPHCNFSNVIGMAELKARLGGIGHEIIDAWRLKMPSRNGILLFGPTGTGKTFLAEALAGELGLKIIKVNFGQIASRWVNQTTEQVMAVFRDAERQAPVVLLMDEIDMILSDRNKVLNADSEVSRLASTFLPAIERLRACGVVIIGVANLLDQLDPAAIREGRFDFKIEIPYPDEESSFAILKDHLIKVGLTTDDETLRRLARRWKGFSVARLHAIVDEITHININGPTNFDDFMTALRKVQGHKGAQEEGGPTLKQLTLPSRMRETLEDIVNRMKNIETIERLGGSLPHGILFFGPSGTGKTFTARALANSADWAFLATTGHDLLTNPKKIDEIIHEASDLRPCIVFVDEADDVFGHRGFSNAANITNKLLSIMDGVNGRIPDVVFIATTNNPDNFDPAALRGGRFTEKVEFKLPDHEVLRNHIQGWIDTARVPILPDVNVHQIAELVLGYPLATVNEVLQAAINRVVSMATTQPEANISISMNDIQEGLRRVIGEKK